MFRRSVVTSTLSLALTPHLVGALGLGDIHIKSALNEPFVGQIELLDVAPDELNTVKVLLAAKAEFDKAGTERPQFLTELEFEPQASSEGRALIRVTSRRPVRESFLDFLIEVNWPQGRLVKAYTVLLDPPVTSNHRPPKGEQSAVRLPSQTPSSEAAGPGANSIKEVLRQVQEVNERTRRIEELRGRIRALETQLADIQRLLALGNQWDAAPRQARQFEGSGVEPDIPSSEREAMQASGGTRSREAAARCRPRTRPLLQPRLASALRLQPSRRMWNRHPLPSARAGNPYPGPPWPCP